MANFTYDNLQLENKFKSILNTKLSLNQFITLDNMVEGAGDTKRIVYRSVSGQVDDVAMGEGNSHTIETTGRYSDFVLKTTQGYGFYYDEEATKDALVVDTLLKGMQESMTNDWNEKIMAQYALADKYEVASSSIDFNDFVDALALFGEKNEGLVAVCNPQEVATLRKNLADSLKYVEAFVRSGYIGSVCGIPVYMSAAVPEGEVYISNKDAIHAFINKSMEVEQKRDPNLRKNEVWMRFVACIALVDDSKVCRIASAATTTTTITAATKNTKIVAGAATTGAIVKVYVNGNFAKEGVASSSAYSITLDTNLAAGDEVVVIARKEGQVSSKKSATVAA